MSGSGIQIDDGEFTRLHNTIFDKLALARFTASEYRCLMYLFRMTYGWQKKEDEISLSQWAKGTGIDPEKRHNVLRTLQGLVAKRVIYTKENGNNKPATWGFNKHFDQWDASLFDSSVISPDNTERPVIAPHNKTVISQDSTPVISRDNTSVISPDNHQRNIKKVKEKNSSAGVPVVLKPQDHPAVQAYRDLHERYPTKAQMKIIAERDPPIANWVRAIRQWAANGYNPRNINRMLEWAFDPSQITERVYRNGANNGSNQRHSAALSGQTDGGDTPALDPEIQRRMDEHRAKRKAEGSRYYQ